MLVILQENIDNLGTVGDLIKVSDGYSRNFLLPRGLVVVADSKNVREIEHHKRILEKKRLAQNECANELATKLNSYSCTFSRKVGKNEKLFGSITSNDIAEELKKAGFEITKQAVE